MSIIITFYEPGACTSVVCAAGRMERIKEIERNAIIVAWRKRDRGQPFDFRNHLYPEFDLHRRHAIPKRVANT